METSVRRWSTFQLAGIKDAQEGTGHTVIIARAGSGKCLGKGTPVLMYDGSIKPVEDVVVGDLVMGPDSEPRTVLSLARGSAPMFKIVPIKGDAWVCNNVHTMTLTGTNYNKGKTRDVDLDVLISESKGKRLDKSWKLLRTGVNFQSQPVAVDPYLLGVWLGDGTSGESQITNSEPEIIEYCKRIAADYGGELVVRPEPEKNSFNLRFRAIVKNSWIHKPFTLRKFFKACSVDGYKQIPREYLINDEKTRMSLLAGLLDTDGYYHCGYYEICSVSHVMADQILFLARSLGLAAYCSDKVVNDVVYKRITISGHLNKIPCLVARKKAAPRGQVKRVTCTGFDALPIGDGEYFGFMLDRDGRFLLGDFTVTHNSTLQEEMICHVPRGMRVLVCAFNVEIKDAFKERETRIRERRPDMGERDLEIKTVCGLGFAVCRYAFRGVKVDEFKAFDQARELIPGDELQPYRSMLIKVAGLAKGFLVDNMRDAFTLCARKGDTELALVRCGIDPERATDEQERHALNQMAKDMLGLMSMAKSDTSRVDFDDMWWLPVVLNLRGWGYDRVFCDEAQDLSYCQFKLIQKMTKRNGRMCFVGDPMQVIYEFRGGTATMLDAIAEDTRAKVLPLSITYRCDKAIVDLAKQVVDDFEARPNAPEGLVEEVSTKEYAAAYELARPGDFIISRKNAPLLSLCIGFLKRGVPAIIRGRKDVAQVLLSLIERSKAKTLDKLNEWVDKWEAREIKRLTKKNPEADTSVVSDTASAIRVLASDVDSVSEIRAKIEVLFTDGDDSRRVVLTSTHRAKGLERDRCIVLADTFRRGSKNSIGTGGEEARLWYVAVTRAKHELFLVSNDGTNEKPKTLAEKAA